jgi:2-hydroxychromene-2-carboxylate isomerase
VNHVLPEVPEWIPVRLSGLAAGGVGAFRCAEEETIFRDEIEARARRHALQAMRWPDPFPADTEFALLAATYAKQVGRAVAFSLAAFRQAFAGGRDLSVRDSVLIAAAACEMHPTAIVKGAGLRSIAARLDRATADAAAAGVLDVPAVVTADGRVFHGDRELEAAAGALAP